MRRAVDDLGQTIVMVTHDPVAAGYADAVVFLADGRIVELDGRTDRRPRARPDEGLRGLIAMWRTTLKSLGAHKRRLLGTCTAVLLGVAFLSGTLVLGDTMTEGFGDMFTEANAGTDAVVRSATEVGEADFSERGLVDRSLVDEVAAVDGVAAAEPRIEGSARIVGADGDPLGGNGPPTLAGNWIADDALNPYDLSEGRAPEAPGEVVIDKAAAEAGDLAVGDTTTVRTPEPIPVTIVGIATFGDADSQGPSPTPRFTTDQAAELFMPDPDRVSSIAVSAAGGVSQDELVQRIDAVLPDGVEASPGAELTAEMEDDIKDDFLGFFETFLLVFAGIALVVATFSIYNTFSILVAQRTRESALLRALGASRGQVLRSIAVEALVVGLVASVVGIVVGLGLASGLLALMGAMGMTMPASSLVVARQHGRDRRRGGRGRHAGGQPRPRRPGGPDRAARGASATSPSTPRPPPGCGLWPASS